MLAQWPGLVVQVGVNPQTVCFENDYDTLTTIPKEKDNKVNLSAYPSPEPTLLTLALGRGRWEVSQKPKLIQNLYQ